MTHDLIIFDPSALATAYDQKLNIVRAKESVTVKSEHCAYGPTVVLEFHNYEHATFAKCKNNISSRHYHSNIIKSSKKEKSYQF